MIKEKDQHSAKTRLPLYLSITMVVGIVGCYFLIPSVKEFLDQAWSVLTSGNQERIRDWVDSFGWFGPVVLVLAMIIQMFLLIIPTIALMVVSILAYGPFFGSLLILASVFAASSVGYVIGRYLSETFVMKLLGKKTEHKIERFIDHYGFWAVIITRLNPFLSNDAISFVGGMLRMGYWKFIGATLIGILPLTIFIAILGKSTDTLKTGLLWGSLVSIVGFGFYIFWDKKHRSNPDEVD